MSKKLENKNYTLVPPDGGWAYAVCIAAIIMMVPSAGFSSAFGLMFNDLMAEIEMSTTYMVLITGCNTMCLAISGYLTSPLLRILSLRQVAYIAVAFFNIGALSVAFANSVTTFFICQSMLQNVGFGVMFILAYTGINEYFSKKRFLAISLLQTSIALAGMCVPFVIKLASDYYGYRGMLIIIACFGMQMFIGATLLQPVAWHLKKEEIQDDTNIEMKTLLTNNKDTITDNANVVKANDIENLSHDNNKEDADDKVLKSNKTTFKHIFKTIIDVKIIKEFLFSVVCFNASTAIFIDFTYNVVIPRTLYAEGKSLEYVAWAVSLLGFGDLTMRMMLIFFNPWFIKIGSKQLHLFASILAFAARVGMLLTSNPIVVLVFVTLIGVSKAFLNVLLPLVIADTVAREKYTRALALSMIAMAVLNLTVGPAIGAIRDYTDNYNMILWIFTVIFLAISLLWVYELKVKTTKKNIGVNY